jgi:hypothetical protein
LDQQLSSYHANMSVALDDGGAGVDPNSKDPYQPGVQDEAIVPTDFNLVRCHSLLS